MLFWRSQHHLYGRLDGKTEADPPGLDGHRDRCYYSDGVLERSSGQIVIALTPPSITNNQVDDGR
jgi:hypothetical protein